MRRFLSIFRITLRDVMIAQFTLVITFAFIFSNQMQRIEVEARRWFTDREFERRMQAELAKTKVDEDELWNSILNFKKQNGVVMPLKDEKACKVAIMRLGFLPRDWSHNDFKSINWTSIIGGYFEMSENLARGYDYHYDVLMGWLTSPPHKDALLKNHKYACVACELVRRDNYCVYISYNRL